METGVYGAKVHTTEVSDLRCFYSWNANRSDASQEAALEFHRVVQAVFRAADMIPFRFPTLMADEVELATAIQEHAAEYHRWLARVRGCVQMEVRIHGREEPELRLGVASGAEYLRAHQHHRQKLELTADGLRARVGVRVHGWRQRDTSDSLRCFALIARDSVGDFQQQLRNGGVPADVVVRVSGPWPPTEFFEGEAREEGKR